MTTLFYLFAYVAIVAFCVIAAQKIISYVNGSPLHVRWELYPVAHEGKKASYGGSFMEEFEWWTKSRKHCVWGDIKAMLIEILFLHLTFQKNFKLWIRTYPFHLGLYLLMGGFFVVLLAALGKLCGWQDSAFFLLVNGLINLMSLVGMIGLIVGCVGLIQRRLTDPGLNKYSSPEHFFNLGMFVVFAVFGLGAWATNASFAVLARDFVYNLITFNFAPLESTAFGVHVFIGLLIMVWIPMTQMSHLLLKYFMWHDIRWGDEPTCDSEANQKKLLEALKFRVSWSAPHIQGDGQKTWAEVATTNPVAKKD